ncbi:glutathione S-transferase family protein [Pseudomonas sp. ME-P-057]|uniref:glutathione S-transferase family protein n=1 Tax=Pseudomonas sp. ME-P-057 TaxID=3040321 RepID=UPI0025561B5E|nr:glutathione S-transferase family protein [Pseudomonas sp. ME-P-057]
MSAPSMTLYYNAASPFARKVLVLLRETSQVDRITLKAVALTPVSPDAEVCANNPSGKIPALRLADDNVIHDSRVILEYLDQQHVGNPLIPKEGSARWRRLTLASLADAVTDAALLIRYETFLRPAEKHWTEWLDGQREKIARSLAYFENEAVTELSSYFDVAAISVACALGYLDFRQPDLGWRSTYPRLASWYYEVSQRPSMVTTQPTV